VINTDGVYQIYACTEDANGNKSDWATTNTFTRDATPPNKPNITANPSSPNGSNGWYIGNVGIAITAGTDATSRTKLYKIHIKWRYKLGKHKC
jgi:hypothetical protein